MLYQINIFGKEFHQFASESLPKGSWMQFYKKEIKCVKAIKFTSELFHYENII